MLINRTPDNQSFFDFAIDDMLIPSCIIPGLYAMVGAAAALGGVTRAGSANQTLERLLTEFRPTVFL